MEKVTLSNGVETIIIVEVDGETAAMLDKDPAARSQYFEMCQNLPVQNDNNKNILNKELVWQSSRHVTKHDEEATYELVQLRSSDKFNAMFKNKKTSFSTVWGYIAKEMLEKGFNVGMGKNGAEKCRQKFANLQKTYIKYIEHVKSTGNDMIKPPLHFDLLHKIFGDKHKANPVHLVDSLPGTQTNKSSFVKHIEATASSSASCSQGSSTSSQDSTPSFSQGSTALSSESCSSADRFSNVQHSLKKPKTNERIADLIQKNHNEVMSHKKLYSDRVFSLLEKQVEQRERLLDIFSSSAKKKNNKRKHSSDESD